MDYDLGVCTCNIRTLNRDSAFIQLADVLMKCRADITAMQDMRWIGKAYKSQAHYGIFYSCHG